MQIVDREQELMSTAGLQSLGGGAGLGRGGLDRQLRIVPSKFNSCKSCTAMAVCRIALPASSQSSADDVHIRASAGRMACTLSDNLLVYATGGLLVQLC